MSKDKKPLAAIEQGTLIELLKVITKRMVKLFPEYKAKPTMHVPFEGFKVHIAYQFSEGATKVLDKTRIYFDVIYDNKGIGENPTTWTMYSKDDRHIKESFDWVVGMANRFIMLHNNIALYKKQNQTILANLPAYFESWQKELTRNKLTCSCKEFTVIFKVCRETSALLKCTNLNVHGNLFDGRNNYDTSQILSNLTYNINLAV